MESLYMTSLSVDYTLDGERKDHREMSVACPRKSDNGRIHLEQSSFDQNLEQSEGNEASRD